MEDEAAAAAAGAPELDPERRDLTALDTFTVDPATARDFDDAVSAVRDGDGIRLWIHIADVAAHVRPGSRLDDEAERARQQRLRPGHGRADAAGGALRRGLQPRPGGRPAGGDGRDPARRRRRGALGALLSQPGPLRRAALLRPARRVLRRSRAAPPSRSPAPLDLARRAAAVLAADAAARRSRSRPRSRSSSSTPTGDVVAAHSVEQTEAHGLIEQLMICTNERVAEHCERRRTPTLYRVHERPDRRASWRWSTKLARARRARRRRCPETISPSARPASWRPRRAGSRRARPSAAATAGRRIHHSCCARSSRPSTRPRNLGHAGLGSPAYCSLHLADPPLPGPDRPPRPALRRSAPARPSPSGPQVRDAGTWCSEREREAMVDRARRRQGLRGVPARARALRGRPRRSLRGRGLGRHRARAPSSASPASSATSTRAFCPRAGCAARSASTSTRPRPRSSAGAAAGACGWATRCRVRVDGVEAVRGRVDLVPAAGGRSGS